MRWLALAPLVACLAACGGSGSEGSGDESAAVAAAIKRAASSTDPALCTQLQTQRFMEQNEFAKGKAAVARCRENAKDAARNPRSTTVSAVKVSGGVAHARAAFEGGSLDGQAVDVRLVKQQGRWKLDHVDDFAKFDRKRFLVALDDSSSGRSLPAATKNCMTGRMARLSDDAIKAMYVNADSARLAAVVGPCFVSLLRQTLAQQKSVPKAVTDCVIAKVDKPPYDAIRRILQGADANQLFTGIAQSCLQNQQT